MISTTATVLVAIAVKTARCLLKEMFVVTITAVMMIQKQIKRENLPFTIIIAITTAKVLTAATITEC